MTGNGWSSEFTIPKILLNNNNKLYGNFFRID